MRYFTVFVAVIFAPTIAFSQGMAGSPHDFGRLRAQPFGRSEDTCQTCHIPHGRDRQTFSAGLKWNRELTDTEFVPYAVVGRKAAGHPDGDTKLCLGCHDGTVGADEWEGRDDSFGTAFVGNAGMGAMVSGRGRAFSSGRAHPVSVPYRYDPQNRDGLNDPHTTPMGSSGVIADVLNDGKIECTTCHDIHGREAAQEGGLLLRASMRASDGGASALCLVCHNK